MVLLCSGNMVWRIWQTPGSPRPNALLLLIIPATGENPLEVEQAAYEVLEGIRTENLLIVRPPEAIPGGDMDMHSFETISLAPIDRRLIVTDTP